MRHDCCNIVRYSDCSYFSCGGPIWEKIKGCFLLPVRPCAHHFYAEMPKLVDVCGMFEHRRGLFLPDFGLQSTGGLLLRVGLLL